MKKIVFLCACCMAVAMQTQSLKLYVSNPADTEQLNAPVVLQLNDYPQIKPEDRSRLAVLIDGQQISAQLDDLNTDGIPDELVFLLSMPAHTTQKIVVKSLPPHKHKTFPKEMNVQMWRKNKEQGTMYEVTEASSTQNDMYNQMHHHGVAWESVLMAYRIYFDNKQTIDIYGKKTPQLELERSLWYPTDEQLAQGFGDDVLRVSGSVGVGTVKPWNGKKAVHVTEFDKRTQRIVAEGNLRTISEIEVEGWKYEGKKINMTVRYTMYARHRDCQVTVLTNTDVDTLVTGVQKVKGGLLLEQPDLVGCWGTDWPVNDTVKYAKETVGLGVTLPQQTAYMQKQDKANNLLFFSTKANVPVTFNITAVSMKEINGPIRSAETFFSYLQQWQKNCTTTLIVTKNKPSKINNSKSKNR